MDVLVEILVGFAHDVCYVLMVAVDGDGVGVVGIVGFGDGDGVAVDAGVIACKVAVLHAYDFVVEHGGVFGPWK